MTTHKPYATVTLNHPDGVPPPQRASPNIHGGAPPAVYTPTYGGPMPMSYAQQYANAAATAGIPSPMHPGGMAGMPVPNSPMQRSSNAGVFSPHGAVNPQRPEHDNRSERSVSSGGGSSAAHDVLPLCPDDNGCLRVNDREHQKQYSHTCRLFPCFHAHLKYHTRYFRHAPGQAATTSSEDGTAPDGGTPSNSSTSSVSRTRAAKHRKQARKALSSVSFNHISPDVPNAQKVVVLHGSRAFEISGDWSNVMLHTFKRYLYQVTGVRPAAQLIKLGSAALTDEAAFLSDLGVTEGSQLVVDVDVTKAATPTPAPIVDPASSGAAKIPMSWL